MKKVALCLLILLVLPALVYAEDIVIDNELLKELQTQDEVRAVVTLNNNESIAVQVDNNDLESLSDNFYIKEISYDYPVKAFIEFSVPFVNGNAVWGEKVSGVNIDGAETSVCVIDTGVDTDHPALAGKVLAQTCFCSGMWLGDGVGCCQGVETSDSAEDDNGHGTFVSGEIVSQDPVRMGLAKGAGVVVVKALDAGGGGYMSDILAGINWCVQNKNQYNISAISMSLGCGLFNAACDADQSCNSNELAVATTAAKNAGIFVAAATGNSGSLTKIASPACLSNVVAVGAVGRRDNDIPDYVNRNQLVDLLAPGGTDADGIVSTFIGGGFASGSGTSMATPFVAGAAALLAQAQKLSGQNVDLDYIFEALNSTGIDIDDTLNSGQHFRRIDVLAGFNAVIVPTVISSYPESKTYAENITRFDLNLSLPVNSVVVSIDGGGNNTLINDSEYHYFNDTLLAGSDAGKETAHTALFWITSEFGKVTNFLVSFIVDKLAPGSVENLGNISSGASWIYWSWADPADADLDHVIVEFKEVNNSVLKGVQALNFTCLDSASNYELSLQTVDAVGNINNSIVKSLGATLVDLSGPGIAITSPIEDKTYHNSAVSYAAKVTDENKLIWCNASTDGAVNVSMILGASTCANSVNSAEANLQSGELSSDYHDLVIYCGDAYGNIGNTSITFEVDTSSSSGGSSGGSDSGGSGGGGGGGTTTTATKETTHKTEETEEVISQEPVKSLESSEGAKITGAGTKILNKIKENKLLVGGSLLIVVLLGGVAYLIKCSKQNDEESY